MARDLTATKPGPGLARRGMRGVIGGGRRRGGMSPVRYPGSRGLAALQPWEGLGRSAANGRFYARLAGEKKPGILDAWFAH